MRKADFVYMFTEIVLRPVLKIADPEQRERAMDLLNRAARALSSLAHSRYTLRLEPGVEVSHELASSESL
jgi:hypothetical protein